MADEPDQPPLFSLATNEVSSPASTDAAIRTDLSGLTAADAEWFDGLAAAKREGAEGCSDPATRAEYEAEAHKYRWAPHLNTGALVEAARTATAASRVMDACTRSAVGQDRLRNGGRQIVTVQHVTVGDGGRAVVAGNVEPRSSRGRQAA
jgi:hypothetical protein